MAVGSMNGWVISDCIDVWDATQAVGSWDQFGYTVIIRVEQQQHGGTSIEFSWNLEFQSLSSSAIDIKLLEDKKISGGEDYNVPPK